MVLTDRQRVDLHAAVFEYLLSRDEFQKAAEAMKAADAESCTAEPLGPGKTPLLEKKWTAIPRLQRKVLELERAAAQSAKIHAHRAGTAATSTEGASAGNRRMLPRLPCSHTLKGHAAVVTCVKVHPVFTVAVSGSEDGTIKVSCVTMALSKDAPIQKSYWLSCTGIIFSYTAMALTDGLASS
jgi:platelet-activating factor acetylhydrolase IB subunit alpha